MNKLQKSLHKLDRKRRDLFEVIFEKLKRGDTEGLAVKKLQGYLYTYRIRKERLRIIYTNIEGVIEIVSVDLRDEKTYKKFK